MEDPGAIRYRQIAVFGTRRNVRGVALEDSRRRLLAIASADGYSRLPALQEGVGAATPFTVPVSGEAVLNYRGIPYDLVEDLLPNSAAWKQVSPVLLPHEDTAIGRPITPLHGGHVGLLCTAGLLNGGFGAGEERHIAWWRSVNDPLAPFGQHERLFQPGIHLVHSASQNMRNDAPPWPNTAIAEEPVQLSLFG